MLLAMLFCWKTHRLILFALFTSMLLHALGDLPLHHDDAHRHFFPFLDWRFSSPISYWNPDFHGHWVSLIEAIAVIAASVLLYLRNPCFRPWVVSIAVAYLGYWIYVYNVWT